MKINPGAKGLSFNAKNYQDDNHDELLFRPNVKIFSVKKCLSKYY